MRAVAALILLFASLFVYGGQPPEISAADSLLQEKEPIPAIISSNDFFGSSHLLPVYSPAARQLNPERHYEWISWVMILSMSALAMGRFLFPLRMKQSFKAILGLRYFNQLEREGSLFGETLTYLLLFNFGVMMALLIFQTLVLIIDPELIPFSPGLLYLLVLGLLLLFYVLKSMITGFIAWIFKTQHANRNYLKNIHLYNQLSGIVLLPLVIYSTYNASLNGIILAWSILGIVAILKVRRNLIIGHKQAGFSAYYIILYLCAVELAPLAVLLKAVSRYIVGIQPSV